MNVLGILASGRGSNCRALLAAAREGRLDASVGLVLSDRPDAPVLGTAKEYGVPARFLDPGRRGARLTPEAEAVYVAALREAGVTWVALAGFMRILGPVFLEGYPGRVLNIHPSLLPAFPGLEAPLQAWQYGVRVAGATVHFVDDGVDTGPIVAQEAVTVHDGDTPEDLAARILTVEHRIYAQALNRVMGGTYHIGERRVTSHPQGDSA